LTTRRVHAPDGRAWSIRRRWIPHREGKGLRARWARRRRLGDIADVPDVGGCADDLTGLAIVLGLIVLIVLIVLFGGPVLLLGIDLLWLLFVGLIGLLGRVVLRRPWRVEAVSGSDRRSWFVSGYRAAGRQRDEVARQLQHGQNPLGSEAATVPS
jgi:hypothetical protein